MRTIRMLGRGQIEVVDIPEPDPVDDYAVVQVMASAICGTERHVFDGDAPIEGNLGHEAAGIVVKTTDRVRFVQEGDRVSLLATSHCGRCLYCLEGHWVLCTGEDRSHRSKRWPFGLHAQYVLVREEFLMPLPDDLSFDVAALLGDAVGTPHRALSRLRVTARDTVLITGQGPLGAAATLLCKFLNARVIATDISDDRLAIARACGADELINVTREDLASHIDELTGGRGVDVALECSGSEAGEVASLDAVRRGGRVGWIGINRHGVTIAADRQLILKEVELIGSWYSRPADHPVMVDLVQRGLDVERMITHRFGIEQAQEAYDTFHSGRGTKVVIHPWET